MAPHLGTTIQFTTTNYPASSGLGVQVLSLVGFDPGIDLTAVGMPGCFRYVNTESTNVVIPVAGQTVFNQLIPNNPVLLGLPLRSQTFAFATGANALGLIASNGVAMIAGLMPLRVAHARGPECRALTRRRGTRRTPAARVRRATHRCRCERTALRSPPTAARARRGSAPRRGDRRRVRQ
jgi:hypothetical protein